MSQPAYEQYLIPCPRCGYPETMDTGPYKNLPESEDQALHLIYCPSCGKESDARELQPGEPARSVRYFVGKREDGTTCTHEEYDQ